MQHPWLVDAFAEQDFRGNPAGVVVTPAGFPPVSRMQAIAHDITLPTTAFVVPVTRTAYRIRWFTPETELNLCGHATLASAAYLYEVAGVPADERLEFATGNGPLYTERHGSRISVDLPRWEVRPCPTPHGLEEALGCRVLRCDRAVDDLLIELDSATAVAALRPDFAALARVDACRGHVVTAPGEPGGAADFVSRSFFPALGVDEDQVCVSAHCKLGPYWQDRLGRARLQAVQLSPRGGRLQLEMVADRVRVTGAVQVRHRLDLVAA